MCQETSRSSFFTVRSCRISNRLPTFPCQTEFESFPRWPIHLTAYLAISLLRCTLGWLRPRSTIKIRSIDEATLILDRVAPPDVPICLLFTLIFRISFCSVSWRFLNRTYKYEKIWSVKESVRNENSTVWQLRGRPSRIGSKWRGVSLLQPWLVSRGTEKNGKIFAGATTVHSVTGRRIPCRNDFVDWHVHPWAMTQRNVLSIDTYLSAESQ